MESTDPSTPIKHIEVTANTANAERKLSEISVTSGYNTESARITLTESLQKYNQALPKLRKSCILIKAVGVSEHLRMRLIWYDSKRGDSNTVIAK